MLLETMISIDMMEHGFDPLNKQDIERYWSVRL